MNGPHLENKEEEEVSVSHFLELLKEVDGQECDHVVLGRLDAVTLRGERKENNIRWRNSRGARVSALPHGQLSQQSPTPKLQQIFSALFSTLGEGPSKLAERLLGTQNDPGSIPDKILKRRCLSVQTIWRQVDSEVI